MWSLWNENYDINNNRIFEIDIYEYETDDVDSTRHYWQTFDIEIGEQIIKALQVRGFPLPTPYQPLLLILLKMIKNDLKTRNIYMNTNSNQQKKSLYKIFKTVFSWYIQQFKNSYN